MHTIRRHKQRTDERALVRFVRKLNKRKIEGKISEEVFEKRVTRRVKKVYPSWEKPGFLLQVSNERLIVFDESSDDLQDVSLDFI